MGVRDRGMGPSFMPIGCIRHGIWISTSRGGTDPFRDRGRRSRLMGTPSSPTGVPLRVRGSPIDHERWSRSVDPGHPSDGGGHQSRVNGSLLRVRGSPVRGTGPSFNEMGTPKSMSGAPIWDEGLTHTGKWSRPCRRRVRASNAKGGARVPARVRWRPRLLHCQPTHPAAPKPLISQVAKERVGWVIIDSRTAPTWMYALWIGKR